MNLREECRAIWDANAAYWDEYMGPEGNRFHRELVQPAADRLLAARSGERVLEVACGAGLYARHLAELGATVVATDFSPVFLERADRRLGGLAERVELRRLDVTDEQDLLALGEAAFDAAVCNMALMDIADIGPLFRAMPRLLRPEGRFVFTLCHPCFNTTGTTRLVEESDSEAGVQRRTAIKVTRYRSLSARKGTGVPGQPAAQYYFDRPLSVLLAEGFRAGMVVDGLEEPAFEQTDPEGRATAQDRFTEFPMVLAVRMRPVR